jgi:hypothetical protein
MAMAPVIDAIPDLIVGDGEGITATTDPNIFVYPDAINLDAVVVDETADASLTWTYTKGTLPGRYLLNGADAINMASENPNSPAATKTIRQVLQGEQNPDNLPQTATIRDNILSPISVGGGLGPYGDPGAPGIVGSEVVTLIASDGLTYTARSLIVYSDNNGNDRITGAGGLPVPIPVVRVPFTQGAQGWTSNVDFGAVTPSQNATTGLCLAVPAAGVNFGAWFSVFGFIPLVDNAVYRVRLTMSTTASLNNTPLWRFVYENGTQSPLTPILAYGGEHLFLDNVGSANAPSPISGGRATFDLYLTPIAVSTAQWKSTTNGPFAAANATSKDARAIFAILDVDGAGYGAETDLGAVCMSEIDIVRWDINTAVVQDAALYNVTSFTDAGVLDANPTPNDYQMDAILGSAISFTGGVASISPTVAGGWEVEVATLRPGDKTVTLTGANAGTDIGDNWPIAWEANQLYQLTTGLSVSAAGEVNPPDILRMTVDQPTQELIYNSYVTTKYDRAGSPKAGAAQSYNFFWYGNNKTVSTVVNFARFRPRLDVICRSDFFLAGQTAATRNTEGVSVHSMSVKKVRFE